MCVEVGNNCYCCKVFYGEIASDGRITEPQIFGTVNNFNSCSLFGDYGAQRVGMYEISKTCYDNRGSF